MAYTKPPRVNFRGAIARLQSKMDVGSRDTGDMFKQTHDALDLLTKGVAELQTAIVSIGDEPFDDYYYRNDNGTLVNY